MSLASKLEQERRARLAAERLLEVKQAELFAANRKLGQHARVLSEQIVETRAEVASVRDENRRVKSDLTAANQKIEIVETQLWKALETVRDGFAMFNSEGSLELANRAYLSIFDGLESIRPGASFSHIVDVMVEEGIVDLNGESGASWRTRMLGRWDLPTIPPETIRLWSGHFIKLMDRRTPDGGLVTLAVDITELMRMWSAVEELPDGFVLFDSDDRLVTCNTRYRAIYDKSAAALEPGNSFEEILRHGLEQGQYAEALGREDAWLEDRLEQHRRAEREVEQQLSDGRWLRIFEKETSDGGRVGLRVDITHLKDQQRALEIATERAEAANRAKSAFLANMSHEIRTPMNGVVGMAELLEDTGLSEEQQLYVRTIRHSGEALLVIINDVLDYSKIEADKLVLHPRPFDLEQAVHEVVMLLQPTARDKGLSLLVDYDMFMPRRFVGDVGRLRQVLTNLMGNAVKFTAQGHVILRVTGVPGQSEPSDLHITVEDTGIGISAEMVDHIFGEFNQIDADRNREYEGTGLGLAITRRLIELMGGEIWVESAPGEGACFGFRIPLPQDPGGQGGESTLAATGLRALVIDPIDASRGILARQLAALGAEVTEVAESSMLPDGAAPQIVLAAHAPPQADGLALARALRADGHTCPVLLLAPPGKAPAPEEAAALGATVLAQPVSQAALRDSLFPAATAEPVEPLPSPQPATAPGAIPALRRMRVLAAEDNRTNQLVLRKMLKDLDIELEFAANGLEAVAQHAGFAPDLIFMDISMPRMDGKEATRHIRAAERETGGHVPIVALTAHAMTGDREAILAEGLDGYLTKPLRKAAIIEAVIAHRPPCARPPAPGCTAPEDQG